MWEPVIGLEIHARLQTRSKLFCPCPTDFGAEPNSSVCPVCLGYPGALPVLNRAAVELAVRMALATGCTVHERSVFARKNYFYPDLPKGYQISQYEEPLATGGRVLVGDRFVRLHRIHIEEDAGKLLHGGGKSLVDLNRAGTPLIEIVSEPDVRSAEEAAAYFSNVRQILMYTGVCDGNMEEGSLRCDANVSLRRPGGPLGTRAEVKNVNSFRYLAQAIAFEIERQTKVLDEGGAVVQETRLFDATTGATRSMRSKEEAHDYRYFPDPDLHPLQIGREWIETVRRSLPELATERSARYRDDWAIPPAEASALAATRELAEYFEAAAEAAGNPRGAANWVRNEVLRVLNDRGIELASFRVTPAMLGSLIRLVDSGAIGGKAAKEVFEEMSAGGGDPEAIVAARGLAQVSDPKAIREAVQRVIDANPAQVEQYRGGKVQVFGFLVGMVMKEMRGKGNAEVVNRVMREMLTGEFEN